VLSEAVLVLVIVIVIVVVVVVVPDFDPEKIIFSFWLFCGWFCILRMVR
jgi:hypothetical protein